MKKYVVVIFFLFLSPLFIAAQAFKQPSSSEILQAMQKLNTTGSVLYMAAHPDDENTRLLAYLANERKLRTGYLSITRGDGGQNLIGKEQGDLLGLVRTNELLAARRTDGAEQFFTRANDFGFSKNPNETFSIWNRDSVLADVVYVIRKFRPDVIICRFPTTGEGGHGHHTASAILAQEAFELAGDPTKFPEQLKYVSVWKPKRVYWNTFNFGANNTIGPGQLKLDVGLYNPLLGKSYGEIAGLSRSMHKSQGFGAALTRGSSIEYFKYQKGDSASSDLFEGTVQDWSRMSGTEKLKKTIDNCIKTFNAQAPEKSLKALAQVYKQLQALDVNDETKKYWRTIKLRECEALMIACSGLWTESFASDYIAIPGRNIYLTSQLVARNKVNITLNKMSYWGQTDTTTSLALKANELYTFHHTDVLVPDVPYSTPYWLKQEHGTGMFTVNEQALIGTPDNDPYAKVIFDVTIEGVNLRIARPVVYKYTDPVKGEVYRPLEILPPATVNPPEKVLIFTNGETRKVMLTIQANTDKVEGKLSVKNDFAYWEITVPDPLFKLAKKGDEVQVEVLVRAKIPFAKSFTIPTDELKFALEMTGMTYDLAIRRIEYDHIPYQFTLSPAKVKLVYVDIKTSGHNIGYIPGAGDDVPASLKQMGYNVTILTDELLETTNLNTFDAVVTGIRAFNTNDRLPLMHARLMEYVRQGGNLVVQYNTNSRVGPLQSNIGPYPFTISRNRVTDENADVRFINDSAKVLNYPNQIGKSDFNGWIQERGIYFATQADSNYVKVFNMNDPNEKPDDGSLIIAKYGKGNFVYTGLAFFRELPAGVPGAYRLFANLLSLPDNQ